MFRADGKLENVPSVPSFPIFFAESALQNSAIGIFSWGIGRLGFAAIYLAVLGGVDVGRAPRQDEAIEAWQ